MKKNLTYLFMLLITACSTANAQGLLKKLKEKAEQVADKTIDKKTDELLNSKNKSSGVAGTTNGQSGANQGNSNGNVSEDPYYRLQNKGGAGLITTPPDVLKNLDESEKSFNANTLGEARLNLQQAMLGVEMQIGKDILSKLPAKVDGLDADKDQEQVVSSGWGWQGLTLTKVYQKDDKRLSVDIVNNNAIVSSYNTFLAGNAFAAQSNANMKQVKLKNYRGILEYSDSDGYKLTIPVGQSSVVMINGINYKDEQELMNAAQSIDLDMIKNSLDEK